MGCSKGGVQRARAAEGWVQVLKEDGTATVEMLGSHEAWVEVTGYDAFAEHVAELMLRKQAAEGKRREKIVLSEAKELMMTGVVVTKCEPKSFLFPPLQFACSNRTYLLLDDLRRSRGGGRPSPKLLWLTSDMKCIKWGDKAKLEKYGHTLGGSATPRSERETSTLQLVSQAAHSLPSDQTGCG